MFDKHATIRPVRSRGAAPRRPSLGNISIIHSDDNKPDFRRPAGRRRCPKPSLICHWIEEGGRLKCHWAVAAGCDESQDNPGRPSAPFDLAEPPRRRGLAAQLSYAT